MIKRQAGLPQREAGGLVSAKIPIRILVSVVMVVCGLKGLELFI